MRAIKEIVIHCSATRAKWMQGATGDAKVSEIKRWHVEERGWSDIGYHLLIDRDGTVYNGRSITRAGAHTRGRNRDTIGICLIGGHGSSETDDFSENFTKAQDKSLRNLIANLQGKHGNLHISGHNEYAAKACPGFGVPEWIAQKPLFKASTPKPTSTPLSKLFALLLGKAKK